MSSKHRITEEVLKKAIASKYGKDESVISILDFDVTEGSNKGDNFACEMKAVKAKVNVDGEEHVEDLMTKAFPFNEFRIKWLVEVPFFIVGDAW